MLLNAQKAEKANADRREREREDRYFQEKTTELNEWKAQERRKQQQRLEKALDDKRLQDEQRREQAEAKAEEKRQADYEDAMMMKRLKASMQKERDDAATTLANEKAKAAVALRENQENLRRKADMKRQQQAQDQKLAEDYIRMEQAKEDARNAALKATADRIQAKMNKGAETKAKEDNRARLDEERAVKEQQRYAREKEEEEERRRKAAKKRTDDQMATLRQQVAFRKKLEEDEMEAMNKQARIFREQEAKYDAEEKKKSDARQRRNMQQQEWLTKQIIEKNTDVNSCDQSQLEVQMNKSLLAHINQKKELILSQSVSAGSLAQRTRDRAAEIEAQQTRPL